MLRQVSAAAASYMDSNCSSKRRGGGGGGRFIKGTLRSVYKASSNKVKPSLSPSRSPSALAATDHGGFMTMMNNNQQKSNMNMNMITATQYYNKVPSTPTSTAASSVGTVIVNQDHLPKHITTATGGGDSYNAAATDRIDALYGGLQVDENVDLKAANYISSVLERFRLEYLN